MSDDLRDPTRDRAALVVRVSAGILFVPASILAFAVLFLEVGPESVYRELPPNAVAWASTVAAGLCIAAVVVVGVDRVRREPQHGIRVWLTLFAVSVLVAQSVHTVAFAGSGQVSFAWSSLAVIATAPLAAVCLTVLCWPTDFEESINVVPGTKPDRASRFIAPNDPL